MLCYQVAQSVSRTFYLVNRGIAKAFWSAARVFVPGGGVDLEPARPSFISYTHLLSQSYPGGTVSPPQLGMEKEQVLPGPKSRTKAARVFIAKLKDLVAEGECEKIKAAGRDIL
jgi:hypothetical protein